MGLTLQRVETPYANKDQLDWLGSQHGLDSADSITLDPAPMLTAFPTGEVPSGVELSQRADGRFGTFLAADVTAGRRRGFLVQSCQVVAGKNTVAALHWHGQVIAAKVPLGVGGAAPTQANHPFIAIV